MASSEQNAPGCLSYSDDMASSRRAENAVLPNNQLLDPICCTNLRDQLDQFWVVEAAISSDDESAALDTLRNREENASNERFAVMGLLKDRCLFPQA